jgi:thioredoxin-related protein
MKISGSLLLFLSLLLLSNTGFAQEKKSDESIQWVNFEEAVENNSKTPKKIFVDMYTHWCGWCKRMDATTFIDPQVTAYINKHFYAVKFNAETKDSIFFKGQYFNFKPEYKSNELAAILMNGQMSYPTSVYLDGESNLIGPVPGYLTAEQFLPVLRYFAEDIYKTTKWDDYVKSSIK